MPSQGKSPLHKDIAGPWQIVVFHTNSMKVEFTANIATEMFYFLKNIRDINFWQIFPNIQKIDKSGNTIAN
jgi:hypothetical protein